MPPAETVRYRPFTVCMAYITYCRAGDFAPRTDDFFNFYMCGGRERPPYKPG